MKITETELKNIMSKLSGTKAEEIHDGTVLIEDVFRLFKNR